MKIKQDFFNGNLFKAYEYFGALVQKDGSVIFRVYAPNADSVTLMGDFSSWEEVEMNRSYDGIYEVHLDNCKEGQMYKYRIKARDGNIIDHTDPFAFGMELRPNFASIIVDLSKFKWTDSKFMHDRNKSFYEPLNIYEIHLGSWKMKNGENIEDRWYTYEELAEILPDYLVKMGYNAVEFMPLSEHPVDISWGYQSTGFFAPTSRYGTPYQLNKLIDTLHSYNIKVFTDFVPVHFATDNYALFHFDGTPLYENMAINGGYSEWGSMNFDYSKGFVCSYLQSCASYWLDVYHFDGIRIDAVSRLIYINGNSDIGINEDGLGFLKNMNKNLQKMYPTSILVAEDSTDYPKVTTSVDYGGLGFDYKWDMGWMNDTLEFFKKTSDERPEYYNTISFSIMYFYSENFMLALSHDENVHGKATIVNKMYGGDLDDKFSQGRVFYMYMMTHPGKKLNFMGSEFAQLREWNEEEQQDWLLLKYPNHDSFREYIKKLNHLYLEKKSLNKDDYNFNSFDWVVVNDKVGVTFAYTREYEKEMIFTCLNFSEKSHKNYHFRFKSPMKFKEILNSDWDIYSGTTLYQDSGHIFETFPKLKWEHENTEHYLLDEYEDLKNKLKLQEKNEKEKSNLLQKLKNLQDELLEKKDLLITKINESKNLAGQSLRDKIVNVEKDIFATEDDIRNIEEKLRSLTILTQRDVSGINYRMSEIEYILKELKNPSNPEYYEYVLSINLNRYSGRMFEMIDK